jgi:DNA-directed RNA polymerase subunit RPC12/RpoP
MKLEETIETMLAELNDPDKRWSCAEEKSQFTDVLGWLKELQMDRYENRCWYCGYTPLENTGHVDNGTNFVQTFRCPGCESEVEYKTPLN